MTTIIVAIISLSQVSFGQVDQLLQQIDTNNVSLVARTNQMRRLLPLAAPSGEVGPEVDFIPPWPEDIGGFSGRHYSAINLPVGDHKARLMVMAANEHEADVLRLLGLETVPTQRPKTHIFVEYQSHRDDAWTSLAELQNDVQCNEMWLYTSPEKCMGSTLRHEVCHVVLNAVVEKPIPVWIDEGFACCVGEQRRFRDEVRIQQREEVLLSDQFPALASLQEMNEMIRSDRSAYAVATAAVTYLLTLGEGPKFLEFAQLASKGNVEEALQKTYGIQSLNELDAMWQADPKIWRELSSDTKSIPREPY